MKVICVLILIFCLNTSAFACLNFYYSTDIDGHLHFADWPILDKPFDLNIDYNKYIKKLQKTAKKLEKTPNDFKLQADYATALLFVHQFEQAATILSNLAQKYPKEYNIATNLGTAYELLGKDDLALAWIKKGLLLNPKSHEGSEWIHVRILEAKLAIKKDPNHLEKQSIIGLTAEHNLSKIELSSYRVALEYQLRTRLGFTPVPNGIMGSLFADLAALYASTWSTHYGILLYKIALKYVENPKLEKHYNSKLKELETFAKSKEFDEKYKKAMAENTIKKPTEGGIIKVSKRRINKYYKPKNNELPKDLASKINLALFPNYTMLTVFPKLEETDLDLAIQKAKTFAIEHLPRDEFQRFSNRVKQETMSEESSRDTIITVTYDSLQNLKNTLNEDTIVSELETNPSTTRTTNQNIFVSYKYWLIAAIIGLCIISFILIRKQRKPQ